MKKTLIITLLSLMASSLFAVNFELKDADTSRVSNFTNDCNAPQNAGVWEMEHIVVMVEDVYPSAENYDEMKLFSSYLEALFCAYVDLTNSTSQPVNTGFGQWEDGQKPIYCVTPNMCPGYAGAASHGSFGFATGQGFFEKNMDEHIRVGDTAFCQVYTYEMHRNFWWGTDHWCEKIGWYVDGNPEGWGHWTLAMNVANGCIMTDYLGVGVFEDDPYTSWDLFYHRNIDPIYYYMDHPEYNFYNTWLHGLIPESMGFGTRGVNNLMTGLAMDSYEKFGRDKWHRGYYEWLASDEIIADENYSDFQNALDNMYRVWSMAADSALINYFESDLRWDISQEAIDWVANKLGTTFNAPSALKAVPASNSSVNLTWNDNNANETGYTLERKGTSDVDFVAVATLAADVTSYTDNVTGVYEYRLSSTNGTETFYTSVTSVNTSILIPSAPTNLRLTKSSSTALFLAWDMPQGETIIGVEIETVGADGKPMKELFAGTDATMTLSGLESNTEYSLKLRTYNESGFSEASESFVTSTNDIVPVAPVLKDIEAAEDGSLVLRWVDKSSNEDGFFIRKQIGNGIYTVIDSVAAGVKIYTDTDVEPGITYTYKIKAYNEVGNSGSSNAESQVPLTSGLECNEVNNMVSIYPNPNDGEFVIKFSDETPYGKTIKLYNALGEIVFAKDVYSSQYTVSQSDLPSGMYFISIDLEDGRKGVKRLVIE